MDDSEQQDERRAPRLLQWLALTLVALLVVAGTVVWVLHEVRSAVAEAVVETIAGP
jgi:hypothetical protein